MDLSADDRLRVFHENLPSVVSRVQVIAPVEIPLNNEMLSTDAHRRDRAVKTRKPRKTRVNAPEQPTNDGHLELIQPKATNGVLTESLAHLPIDLIFVLCDQIHVPAVLARMNHPVDNAGPRLVLKRTRIQPSAELVQHQDTVLFLVVAARIAVAELEKRQAGRFIRNPNVRSGPKRRNEGAKVQIKICRNPLAGEKRLLNLPHAKLRLARAQLASDHVNRHDQ